MSEEQNLKESRRLIGKLGNLKKNYDLVARDKRYNEYNALVQLLEDGELITKRMKYLETMIQDCQNKIGMLRKHSPAVNTMVTEIERGVPISQRRSDEQLIKGHYAGEAAENEPVTERMQEPIKPLSEPKSEDVKKKSIKKEENLFEDDDVDLEGLKDLEDEEDN